MTNDLSGLLLVLLDSLASALKTAFLEIDPDQSPIKRDQDHRHHSVQAASLALR